MVALTDMTVQYTVLVDAHIPRLAACLADPNELVRRQALALLASLLSRVGRPPPAAHSALLHSRRFTIAEWAWTWRATSSRDFAQVLAVTI